MDVANTFYELALDYSKIEKIDLANKNCLTESDRIWKVKLKSSKKLSAVLLLSTNLC